MLKCVFAMLIACLAVSGVFADDKQQAEINAKLVALLEKQDRRIENVETRLDGVEGRLAQVERRLNGYQPQSFTPSASRTPTATLTNNAKVPYEYCNCTPSRSNLLTPRQNQAPSVAPSPLPPSLPLDLQRQLTNYIYFPDGRDAGYGYFGPASGFDPKDMDRRKHMIFINNAYFGALQ